MKPISVDGYILYRHQTVANFNELVKQSYLDPYLVDKYQTQIHKEK